MKFLDLEDNLETVEIDRKYNPYTGQYIYDRIIKISGSKETASGCANKGFVAACFSQLNLKYYLLNRWGITLNIALTEFHLMPKQERTLIYDLSQLEEKESKRRSIFYQRIEKSYNRFEIMDIE